MRKYTLHWKLHPEKDEVWYEEQKKRRTEDAVARELDINYALSVSGKVFSSFREDRHVSTIRLSWNPNLYVYRIWDFGKTNATLYAQVDNYGRKRILHERVLGDAENPSTWEEQKRVAFQDSANLFDGASFFDICDPAGDWDDHRGSSPEVADLRDNHRIYPQFDRIKSLPTRERKTRGRKLIEDDLQVTPGGQEALLLFVSSNLDEGCPILKKAFQGGYCYKKDTMGNILDKIQERHPYEDVIDCLIYLYLETDGYSGGDTDDVEPIFNTTYINPYTGV